MKTTLIFIAHFFMISIVSAQTEQFDIVTFIPPPGWQRIDTNGTVAFMDSKTIDGLTSFCQIILYPSSNSTNTADKNFKTAWQNLVTVPAKSKVKPIAQTQKTPDGWTVVTGAANISLHGMTYKSIVTNVTGFGKTMSVQVNTAGGDYAAVLEKFFNVLNLDSKATVSNTQTNNMSTSNQSTMNKTITISDYVFIAPDKWQRQNNNDHIAFINLQSGCTIKILSPQPSSGNLEQDANAVFDMMYNGWNYQKSGDRKFVLAKGFLHKGAEYFIKEATMSGLNAQGQYMIEEGTAMVVKAGNQIIIISVRHNSSTLGHNDCQKYETWRRFFNSFTVKNAVVPKIEEDAAGTIIGAWSQTESGASSEYLFAANGNYALIGAIGSTHTSSDYRFEYLHIKTYAFAGDGSYSISGNQVTLKKRNQNPEQVRFRFEKVNYGGTGWRDRICLLKRNVSDGNEYEVCYEKR